MPNVNDYDDTPDTITVSLSRRDLEQILTAMENRGDDRNGDPQWSGLFQRLALAAPWNERQQ